MARRYVTVTDLASRWGVSRQSIYQAVERGRMRSKKVGAQVYIPVEEVNRIDATARRKLTRKMEQVKHALRALETPPDDFEVEK